MLLKGKNCRASRGQDGVGGTLEHKQDTQERGSVETSESIFPENCLSQLEYSWEGGGGLLPRRGGITARIGAY